MTLYFLVKYLHLLGAIVILGTGAGIAFFMLMAHRSGEAASSHVILQPVTGAILMVLSSVLAEVWLTGRSDAGLGC